MLFINVIIIDLNYFCLIRFTGISSLYVVSAYIMLLDNTLLFISDVSHIFFYDYDFNLFISLKLFITFCDFYNLGF
jgi:hypothetical protein